MQAKKAKLPFDTKFGRSTVQTERPCRGYRFMNLIHGIWENKVHCESQHGTKARFMRVFLFYFWFLWKPVEMPSPLFSRLGWSWYAFWVWTTCCLAKNCQLPSVTMPLSKDRVRVRVRDRDLWDRPQQPPRPWMQEKQWWKMRWD